MISGCSYYQIASEETTFDSYPPKNSKDEVAYLEQVTQPHKVIGYVTVNVERNQKPDEILNKLKVEAASLGGDAITNITFNSGREKWTQNKALKILANANIRENYMADVIKFDTPQNSK